MMGIMRSGLAVLALGLLAACGVDGPPTPPSDTTTQPTMSGTVGVGVSNSGPVGFGSVTLRDGPFSLTVSGCRGGYHRHLC